MWKVRLTFGETFHFCNRIANKINSSAYCVPMEMVCDTRADCPNGADEQFCNGIYQYESE